MSAIFFYERGARGATPVKLSSEPDGYYAKSAYARMIDGTKRTLTDEESALPLDDLAKRYPAKS